MQSPRYESPFSNSQQSQSHYSQSPSYSGIGSPQQAISERKREEEEDDEREGERAGEIDEDK